MARHRRKRIIRDSQPPRSPSLTDGHDVVSHVKTTTQSPGLFVLSLELRLMIYEYVFVTEKTDTVPAYSKFPILLTNKTISFEAKPVLYQHHEFHFACGGWRFGSPCSDASLGWMTKISLHNHRHFFPKYDTSLSVRAQLFVLHRYALRLTSLKIDFHLSRKENRPQGAFLSGLWDRLNYIEARFTQQSSCVPGIETLLIAIAPLAEWRESEVRLLEGYDVEPLGSKRKMVKDLPQRTYWLSRSKRRMRDLGSA